MVCLFPYTLYLIPYTLISYTLIKKKEKEKEKEKKKKKEKEKEKEK